MAVALRILPRPLGHLAATSLPALYFPARIAPRLALPIVWSALGAVVLAAFLPAWHSSAPADLALGKATALASAPLLIRIATWRDRSGAWDVLDPLVVATWPLAFVSSFAVARRLFELGILAWD